MDNEKELIDYDNLAFNPYAISTGDLTIKDDNIKSGKSMDNHGYIQSEAVVENNPHYEDTLEVVKKAGLTGTGRRKKANIIYEETIINKKNKDKNKNRIPKHRAANLPPRPTEEWREPSKNNQWKMPFAILCVLVLLGLVGGALGVLAYIDKKDCSCDVSKDPQTQGSISPQETDELENLKKTVKELWQQLIELQTNLDDVKKKQQKQEVEQKAKLKNTTKFTEHLSTRIDVINSTFITKFNSVTSNVSNLAKTIDEFNVTLWNTSRQLSNTINLINATLTIKLTNVSKQIGPRGYNGSRGFEGPQGIGNISACIVDKKTVSASAISTHPNDIKIQAVVQAQQGYKIIAADCSTNERNGAGQTALSRREPDTYVCTCAGKSIYGPFLPTQIIECVLMFWQCPLLT